MADGDDKQQSTTLAELHQIVKNIQYNTTVIIENNRKLERSQEELANSLAYHVKTVEEVVSKNLHIEHEQMGHSKSPGNDGLTKEFYLGFWDKLVVKVQQAAPQLAKSHEPKRSDAQVDEVYRSSASSEEENNEKNSFDDDIGSYRRESPDFGRWAIPSRRG
ncbi:hypothetical protein QZH41_007110 [Actinostola sp. cb2023]|nr:hypothetical protein QZH41_007110 [Actinostola sp. cb2023]